jgi:hypothetical protein
MSQPCRLLGAFAADDVEKAAMKVCRSVSWLVASGRHVAFALPAFRALPMRSPTYSGGLTRCKAFAAIAKEPLARLVQLQGFTPKVGQF